MSTMISYLVTYSMPENLAHIKKALQEAIFDKIEVQMASLRKAISSIEESKMKTREMMSLGDIISARALM